MTRGQRGSLLLHRDGLATVYLLPVSRRTAAQWLACAIPYRRFSAGLTATDARLGDDAVVG